MGDLSGDRFLVDGKCSVCGTTVLSECAGGFLRFIPHDDPEWCRGAAVLLVRSLTRALHQANEDAAMAQEREKFYRSAYATAVDELEHVCDMVETPQRSREEWRRHIEQLVRVETEEARAGRGVQHAEAMMKLGMVPR